MGFRVGICQAFQPFDILNRKKLRLLEIPTTVMDCTLNSPHAEALTPKKSIELTSKLLNRVKKYNGDFVFLWHNSSFDYSIYREHGAVYSAVLRMAENLGLSQDEAVLERQSTTITA